MNRDQNEHQMIIDDTFGAENQNNDNNLNLNEIISDEKPFKDTTLNDLFMSDEDEEEDDDLKYLNVLDLAPKEVSKLENYCINDTINEEQTSKSIQLINKGLVNLINEDLRPSEQSPIVVTKSSNSTSTPRSILKKVFKESRG